MKRLAVIVAVAVATGGLGLAAAARVMSSSAGCPAAVSGQTDLGRLAFIRGGRLELLEVASCRVRTLVSKGVEPPVRWSADGRYVAFGNGGVVAASGGTATHPLGWGTGSRGWVWSPSGHTLAGVTTTGGVVTGGTGSPPKRLLPDGWGATSVAFSPDGRTLAAGRSLYLKVPPPYHQEVWLLDLANGRKREIFRQPKGALAPPWLYGFSPDGRWLIAWEDTQNSASLAADGLPLVAMPVNGSRPIAVGKGTLAYGDFLSWCGNALAYVLDRGGREVTLHDRIALAAPPKWQAVEVAAVGAAAPLSFNSPACSPPGTFEMAAAVGPSTRDEPFGHERRRIWLLGYTGGNWHPLGPAPPAGESDELPLWSSDGRWIAFIRTTWSTRQGKGTGRLYLLDLGKQFNGHATPIGPIADLGASSNYYGHYSWGDQVAWTPN